MPDPVGRVPGIKEKLGPRDGQSLHRQLRKRSFVQVRLLILGDKGVQALVYATAHSDLAGLKVFLESLQLRLGSIDLAGIDQALVASRNCGRQAQSDDGYSRRCQESAR